MKIDMPLRFEEDPEVIPDEDFREPAALEVPEPGEGPDVLRIKN